MYKKIVPLLFVVIAVIVLFFKFNPLTIGSVKISADQEGCVSSNGLENEINLNNKNFLLINKDEIKQRIINKYPCIKNVFLSYNFPGRVQVLVNFRKPFVRVDSIKSSKPVIFDNLEATPSSQAALLDWSFPVSSGSYFIADDMGVVFSQTEATGSPFLFVEDQDINIGKRLDSDLFSKVALIVGKTKELGLLTTRAKIVDNYLLTESSERIVFGLGNDVLKQIASLQLILQKAKIDGKAISMIDLRFDKPIIMYVSK